MRKIFTKTIDKVNNFRYNVNVIQKGDDKVNTVAERRKEAGLTQKQLANLLGLKRSSISKWENGASKHRAETLKKLADLLNCTVDELLKEAG